MRPASRVWLGLRLLIKRDLDEEIKRDDRDRERGSEHKALGHDCDSKMWRSVFGVINQ